MIRNVEDGDIKTSGVQFVEGRAEVAQGIRARLLMFLGESFLDISKGTPWFQAILGKTPQDVAEVNVKRRIFTAPGVLQLRAFSFNADTGRRTIDISARVISERGEDVELSLSEVIV